MIDVLIGSQGAGKSLTSIHFLFELIDKEDENGKVIKVPRHSIYKRLITNVGGFKVDLFRHLSGNKEIEIIHEDKHWDKTDLELRFLEQMEEEKKPQEERIPTLFIYDECQFALSTFSSSQANIAQCELISNFFSLQRHYGPCDFLLMTQSLDKIHRKYLGDDFHLYISLEYSKKADPENDIVFDLYDCDAKNIITGGRSKIKYKKSKKLKDTEGKEFNPFDLYVSGDAGRKPVEKKSYWKKYIYILLFMLLFAVGAFAYVMYKVLHQNISIPVKKDVNVSKKIKIDNNVSIKRLQKVVKEQDDGAFDKYVQTDYHKIDAQINYKVFSLNGVYYFGSQIMSLKGFNALVKLNKLFIVSTQPITKNSFYVNVLVSQSVLNSFGVVKDFDKSADKRVKSSTKAN